MVVSDAGLLTNPRMRNGPLNPTVNIHSAKICHELFILTYIISDYNNSLTKVLKECSVKKNKKLKNVTSSKIQLRI